MIVCLCHGVPERTIRQLAGEGARDLDAVARHCDAGTGCGACQPEIERIICEHAGETCLARAPRHAPRPAHALPLLNEALLAAAGATR